MLCLDLTKGLRQSVDGFRVNYCFDSYARRLDFVDAKNEERQWKNSENLLLKQIIEFLRKKVTSSVSLFSFLKITHFLYCNYI